MKKQLIVLALIIITCTLSACGYMPVFFEVGHDTVPSDKLMVKSFEVSCVNGIEMRTYGKVNLRQGDCESLTISGPDHIVPRVIVENRDGTLVLDIDKSMKLFKLPGTGGLTFDIQFKELDSLLVSGLGHVELPSLTTRNLDISISGSGQVKLNQIHAEDVQLNISGLGNISVNGQAGHVTVGIPGNGDVLAGDLLCKDAKVNISGLGNATVWATDKLTGNISGRGSVSYYGDPTMKSSATGHGTFKSLGSKQSS